VNKHIVQLIAMAAILAARKLAQRDDGD
jgi:hypothetical protein